LAKSKQGEDDGVVDVDADCESPMKLEKTENN